MLDLFLRVSVLTFMVGSLAGVGLALTPAEALTPLRHVRFVMLSLLIVWVVCPAIAYGVLLLIPLQRPYATGLLLLALAPCAPFAPAMVQVARGDTSFLAAFMLLCAVTTVIVMPVAAPVLIDGLTVDAMAITRPLVLFVLLPLVLGMAARGIAAPVAEKARTPVTIVTHVAGAVALLLVVVEHTAGVLAAIGSYAMATQVLVVGGSTLAAHGFGAALPAAQRRVVTIGTCTRNLGAALAPLTAVDTDPRTIVMIAMAAPVTLALSASTARWLARRDGQIAVAARGETSVSPSSSA